MTTAILILLAVVVLVALVGVCVQMTQDGSMWIMHACLNTPGKLLEVLGVLVVAIVEGLSSS